MNDKTGFVYVMTKNDLPYYYKVGCTEKKPHLRAKELDGTDSPMPSVVTYYVFCSEYQLLESESHKALSDFRVRENREWFKCTRDGAISAIRASAINLSIELYFEKNDLEDPHKFSEKREKELRIEPSLRQGNVGSPDFIKNLLVMFSEVSNRRDVEASENLILYNNRISDLKKQRYNKGRFVDLCDAAREDYLRRDLEIKHVVERSLSFHYQHNKSNMSSSLLLGINKVAQRIIDGESVIVGFEGQGMTCNFISGCSELDDVMKAFTLKNISNSTS